MSLNIAKSNKKRVVIVGGGFGGLKLANKLKKSGFQVVLIDKNNYHQFPPLIYQVASAGMEPTSISFPFRKIFQHRKDFYFRMAEVRAIFPEKNMIQTSIGKAEYDYLVLAAGTTTNYFGNKHIEEEAMPMKNVSEAMGLRNALLANLERALTCSTKQEQQELLNIVIVGGGATGIEVAGILSEMKKFVLPNDYPDMPSSLMHIYLIEAGPRLLAGMSEESSAHAEQFLREMGVNILLNKRVVDYRDHKVVLEDGTEIATRTFIWVKLADMSLSSLAPIQDMSLSNLELRNIDYTEDTVINDYLIYIAKHNNQRRNCKVILDTQPSGTYKEPLKDSNGNYVITTGMEAIYVITHETAWNEAGSWSFDINGTIYQYENSDIA